MDRKTENNNPTNEENGQEAWRGQNQYEYLDSIDFLKHVDLSDYEKEVFQMKPREDGKDQIKVNVDYLDDLAYFDELDYFEQLNKSLEKELGDLDGKIHTPSIATKRRRVRRHSNAFMVAAGMGILLLIGGGIVTAVGMNLTKSDVSYASSEHIQNEEEGKMQVTEKTAKPATMSNVPFVEAVETQNQASQPRKVSKPMIQKREKISAAKPEAKATNSPEKKNEDKASKGDIESFFSDSVFVGNSLIDGLHFAGGPKSAKYIAATSLNVTDVFTRRFAKGSKTAFEALQDVDCSKVFIMFGINEVGWPNCNIYEQRYIKVVNKIKEIKPNAKIYVLSMLPVSKKLTEEDPQEYRIPNMKRFNKAMQNAAKKTGTTFIDVAPSVAGSDGFLPADAARDGMHMKTSYNLQWVNYLYNKAK